MEPDQQWKSLNQQVQSAMEKNDFQELSRIYFEMALFLNKEGKNNFHLLQQSKRMELLDLKREGTLKKVEILADSSSCSECQKLNGQIYTIDEALKKMPLPNKNCQNEYCRCCYLPVVPEL